MIKGLMNRKADLFRHRSTENTEETKSDADVPLMRTVLRF